MVGLLSSMLNPFMGLLRIFCSLLCHFCLRFLLREWDMPTLYNEEPYYHYWEESKAIKISNYWIY